MSNITITGWTEEKGAAYHTWVAEMNQATFGTDRKRTGGTQHRKGSYDKPAWQQIENYLLLNKGSLYKVSVNDDNALIDATDYIALRVDSDAVVVVEPAK